MASGLNGLRRYTAAAVAGRGNVVPEIPLESNALPTGTVTFLFTDLEESTRLWEEQPEAMRAALARHHLILQKAVEERGGSVFSRMGDGIVAVFASAPAALEAAVGVQSLLQREMWGTSRPLRARMTLHTGDGILVDGHYLNSPLNRCARLMAAGHGGQVLLSGSTEGLVRDALPEQVVLSDLGSHRSPPSRPCDCSIPTPAISRCR